MSPRSLRIASFSCALSLVGIGSAQAVIARVFVSVNGNDANPCENIGTPCRTFAAAINRVDADGEVIVLDTGSYGGTNITKGVKINVPLGVVAFAAQPFTINAPGAVVVIRGVTLKALTAGSGVGITYTTAAALFVENCVIDGWQDGIDINNDGAFLIKDTTIRNTGFNAVNVQPGSANLKGAVENSRFENGFNGLIVYGGKVSMRNSVL